jgi:hypothetical protein
MALLAAPPEAQPPSAHVPASSNAAIAARGHFRLAAAKIPGASFIAPSDIFKNR